jgi:hypothetical protein
MNNWPLLDDLTSGIHKILNAHRIRMKTLKSYTQSCQSIWLYCKLHLGTYQRTNSYITRLSKEERLLFYTTHEFRNTEENMFDVCSKDWNKRVLCCICAMDLKLLKRHLICNPKVVGSITERSQITPWQLISSIEPNGHLSLTADSEIMLDK